MPRETISDATGAYDVKVGWQPDRDVQVGVVTTAPTLLRQLYSEPTMLETIGLDLKARFGIEISDDLTNEEKSEAMRQIAIAARDAFDNVSFDPDGPYLGVWSTLDRAGCNRLIRVLRRARDAAFGRDE